MSDRRWIVVATRTSWDEPPRIRHQVARGLASYYSVLYVHFPAAWRPKYGTRLCDCEPGIRVWSPSNWLTVSDRFVAHCPVLQYPERQRLSSQFERLTKSFGQPPVALINFDHRHLWVQNRRIFPRIVYICNDDFPGQLRAAGYVRMAEWTQKQIFAAVAASDVSLATSPYIAENVLCAETSRLFFPGHDLPTSESRRVFPYRSGERIRVGFMGYIDHRIGGEWVARVTQQPDMEYHMIGPIADSRLKASLTSSGVVLHNALTGEGLLEWLKTMDVLTIPYVVSPNLARAMTPNKVYAYFAAGKPTVLSHLLTVPQSVVSHVYRAANADEFVAQIRLARSEDNLRTSTERLQIAAANTWSERIKELCRIIDGESTGKVN